MSFHSRSFKSYSRALLSLLIVPDLIGCTGIVSNSTSNPERADYVFDAEEFSKLATERFNEFDFKGKIVRVSGKIADYGQLDEDTEIGGDRFTTGSNYIGILEFSPETGYVLIKGGATEVSPVSRTDNIKCIMRDGKPHSIPKLHVGGSVEVQGKVASWVRHWFTNAAVIRMYDCNIITLTPPE